MLIDTHAHLNFHAFKKDRDEIIQRCLRQDIWMINVGSKYTTSKKAVEIAQQYNKGVYAAIGLHPIHTIETPIDNKEITSGISNKPEVFSKEKYLELAQQEKVVAIGEIGLDYAYAKTKEEKKVQAQIFKEQLSLAQEVNLPIIIHCRDAWQDLIKILEQFCKEKNNLKGVAHFFSGTIEDAQKLFKLGFMVSFTGVITFTNSYDKTIKQIPLEKIMIETDCPYVAPKPYRGKRNSPLYVKYVAQKIAKLKQRPYQQIANVTTKNAKLFFELL